MTPWNEDWINTIFCGMKEFPMKVKCYYFSLTVYLHNTLTVYSFDNSEINLNCIPLLYCGVLMLWYELLVRCWNALNLSDMDFVFGGSYN